MTVVAGSSVPMPSRIRALPRDGSGHPVPWFVDDQPGSRRDYRAATTGKRITAIRDGVCWVCGQLLPTGERTKRQNTPVPFTFLMPPMCTVDRVAPDPPAHEQCATYAVRACPFLSRADGMVTWSTTGYRVERPPYGMGGRVLLKLADPLGVTWWVQGRHATRDEAVAQLTAGFTRLREECRYDPDPDGAAAALDRQMRNAARLLPAP